MITPLLRLLSNWIVLLTSPVWILPVFLWMVASDVFYGGKRCHSWRAYISGQEWIR